MCEFKRIIKHQNYIYENIEYFFDILRLYQKYLKYLSDDYTKTRPIENLLNYIEKLNGNFWIILDDNGSFAGFVLLDNWVGGENIFHSAEITVCFDKKYWGNFTKECGKKFIKYCFQHYGLKKLKAVIFPDNTRVLKLLEACGFKKEATLISETLRNGKLQDVDIYSIVKE